jgi:hypothetical protein
VKRLLQLFAIVLAVLWAPLTSHCTWENFPGLQFMQCATDTTENSDCEDDACATLEKAWYKVAETDTAVPLPFLHVLFHLSSIDFTPSEQMASLTSVPGDIPTGWQFTFRTALPSRAPSFVS